MAGSSALPNSTIIGSLLSLGCDRRSVRWRLAALWSWPGWLRCVQRSSGEEVGLLGSHVCQFRGVGVALDLSQLGRL
ncbi:hypothetical protein ACFFX0_30195 [Citricoccus parietis]|uniref:Uncharacterized protein n=1 Tax=Citricoccus parietis TaxID=592307 RepID=A0ABV5G993_9MICC